ncbi:nucleotidyltransferase domain-containing protein [Planococcus sp. NCCP-2050]|uniref:nucleotidyltransferase domain-containing protein n=1 Tax=Planococcus sp. NCCP-2050 TaxID=2944679 RepID=UPI002041F194|nr:nucleotidyltransferase domain-containing protein [Planococcus sp. NCCP-2050]GKW45948.1 nucleotidyltransferase [Planococcus sp. NCCP-2050]
MQFPTRIGIDPAGYILNQTSTQKIHPVYRELLNQILARLKRCAGAKLHSVYIYGSVGRGEAVQGTSDIDLTVLLTSPLLPKEKALLDRETAALVRLNPLVPKVDYDMGVVGEVLKQENQFYWGFWLKHVCSCIYGEDLSVKWPQMKPDIRICQAMNQDLMETLAGYRKAILEKETDAYTLQSILKRIVRGAYCYVAVRDESWSTDIRENLQILQHYFPDEAYFKGIEEGLLLQKPLNRDDVLNCLDYFITWFSEHSIEGKE